MLKFVLFYYIFIYSGRHGEAVGEEQGGHLHVRTEHHCRGAQVTQSPLPVQCILLPTQCILIPVMYIWPIMLATSVLWLTQALSCGPRPSN